MTDLERADAALVAAQATREALAMRLLPLRKAEDAARASHAQLVSRIAAGETVLPIDMVKSARTVRAASDAYNLVRLAWEQQSEVVDSAETHARAVSAATT